MIEPRQIRAARALLNWSQTDLAEASGIAVSSIKNVENSITTARKETLEDIQKGLEKAGIEFVVDGVKLRRPDVQILNGTEGFRQFYNLVYAEMQQGGEIYISGVDESLVAQALGEEFTAFHRDRMQDIKEKISVKCLMPEGNSNFIASVYCEYRWIPIEFYETTHFYIFNNKVAIITFLSEASPQDVHVVILDVPHLSEFYKKIFKKLWMDSKTSQSDLKK